MRRPLILLVCAVAGSLTAAAQEHDYFRNARFPGNLREDVELDKVEQAPSATAQPGRRVVRWWPKRGVDRVDVPKGVPLRTWTIRTVAEELLVEMGYLSKWWDPTLEGPKQFEAHLLGCQSCLADYVALKREIETAELDERPSAAARQRLVRAMALELGIETEPRPWSWWERPVAFGFAGAALVAAAMAVGVVVGLVSISLFLPLFDLTSAMG